jgi:hypothetical protein
LSTWVYLQFSNNFQFFYNTKVKDLIALLLPPDTGDCIASSGEILYCLSAIAIHRLLLHFFISHVVGVETVAWSPFFWNLEIPCLVDYLASNYGTQYCFKFFVVISFSLNTSRCQTVSIFVLHVQPNFWFVAQSNFHIEIFPK